MYLDDFQNDVDISNYEGAEQRVIRDHIGDPAISFHDLVQYVGRGPSQWQSHVLYGAHDENDDHFVKTAFKLMVTLQSGCVIKILTLCRIQKICFQKYQ